MKIKLDPTGHHNRKSTTDAQREDVRRKLVMALGIVPVFVDDAYKAAGEDATVEEMHKGTTGAYQWYIGDMEGGTINDEGVYQYPEDPDLHPLVEWSLDSGTKVYMYQYAIVAFTDGETTKVTRMD